MFLQIRMRHVMKVHMYHLPFLKTRDGIALSAHIREERLQLLSSDGNQHTPEKIHKQDCTWFLHDGFSKRLRILISVDGESFWYRRQIARRHAMTGVYHEV